MESGLQTSPTTAKKSPLPARAFGVIPLKIDETQRRLSIEMSLNQTNDAGDMQKIPLASPERNIESAEVPIGLGYLAPTVAK